MTSQSPSSPAPRRGVIDLVLGQVRDSLLVLGLALPGYLLGLLVGRPATLAIVFGLGIPLVFLLIMLIMARTARLESTREAIEAAQSEGHVTGNLLERVQTIPSVSRMGLGFLPSLTVSTLVLLGLLALLGT